MTGRVVLLTRPEPQSRALAEALAAQGWRPLIWPLLTIEPVGPPPDAAGAQAVLLSSANAARRLAPISPPVLCVGEATARAARAAGAASVVSADGDAAALAALAERMLKPEKGPLLFARGAEVAGDLAGALRARGFEVREQIVYEARAATAAPADISAALHGGRVDVATFFSPRSASAFAALAGPWRRGLGATVALAISAAAAESLAGLGFHEIRVADAPDGAAMRAALDAFGAQAGGPQAKGPGAAT